MAGIIENLQLLLESKKAIKKSLEDKGKAPSDQLSTYAGLIDDLENDEQVTYVLTNAAGTQRAYAVTSGEEPVTLTATPNDIREHTTAVTNEGYTEGTKTIPSYQSQKGVKIVQPNIRVVFKHETNYNYTNFQATLAVFNKSLNESVQVDRVTVDNALYTANTTEKLSDLIKDHDNKQVDFGITNSGTTAIMRYFIMREEA